MNSINNLLTEFSACRTKSALQDLVEKKLHDLLNVDSVIISPRLNPGLEQYRNQMLSTGDDLFMKLWLERRLYVHDPIYHWSLKAKEPFYFRDALKNTRKPPPMRRLLDIRKEYGRLEGYVKPLRGGTLSVASPQKFFLELESIRILDHIAQPLLDHCLHITSDRKPKFHLTPKLLEFLYYIDSNIEGESTIELREKTCDYMRITHRTYYDYWQRLQNTLGVDSQTAVMLAARRADLLPGG
jgi:autoinducer binding domain-containing protein